MTANVNIKRSDLHLAVSEAFNRGRYVLMTGGGDGQPVEITIDLRERPDDLFEADLTDLSGLRIAEKRGPSEDAPHYWDGSAKVYPNVRREDIGKWRPFVTDDHGPAIRAQGWTGLDMAKGRDVSVYEFALQDYWAANEEVVEHLADVRLEDAPDLDAAYAANWVHVYDRATRERRTLKRPEPDAVLTGLRDVAADLRRQAFEGSDPTKPYDGSGMVKGMADLSPLIVTRDGVPCEDQGAALEEFKARCTRGAPVEPPFGCAPLPPVGPLTSTEGLRVGDIVRFLDGCPTLGETGAFVRVSQITPDKRVGVAHHNAGVPSWKADRFAFVGRPDASGWMAWAGGENPVPGAAVDVRFRDGSTEPALRSNTWTWTHVGDHPRDIVAFLIVDTPPAV